MIDSLLQNEADMICASFTLNYNRSQVIDFLLPIGNEVYYMFVMVQGNDAYDWGLYVQAFSAALWAAILTAAIVFGLFCSFIEQYRQKIQYAFVKPSDGVIG